MSDSAVAPYRQTVVATHMGTHMGVESMGKRSGGRTRDCGSLPWASQGPKNVLGWLVVMLEFYVRLTFR